MNAFAPLLADYKVVRQSPCLKPNTIAKNVTILVTCLVSIFYSSIVDASDGCKLAVLGDSLTAGYGVEASDAFPKQLSDRLIAEDIQCTVINAGVSGDTSAGGASRIGWVLADQPSHLLIELGGNDALRALPSDQMRSNLTNIIEAARKENVEVMLAGMLAPPNLGNTYGKAFQAVFIELAEAYELAFYPFFLEGVAGNRNLLIEDGIHPNAEGVAVIVERILPSVREFLSSR